MCMDKGVIYCCGCIHISRKGSLWRPDVGVARSGFGELFAVNWVWKGVVRASLRPSSRSSDGLILFLSVR